MQFTKAQNFCSLYTRQGWKSGYLLLRCQFQFECGDKQMPGIRFGLISRMLKIGLSFGFSFACAWLRFWGFSFGLSFIQENCIFFNAHYLSALFFRDFALLQ